jgi:acyl-CoA synthetase (AMP-forming)/AMP-acid ligase II
MTASPAEARLLHDLLDLAARRWPRRTALSTPEGALTYAELAARSRRAGALLAGRGVRRGDRVVITATDGLGTTAMLYGASRVGAAFSVLHEQVRGAPLAHVLADCEPALLVTDAPEAADTARHAGVATALLERDVEEDGPGAGPGPGPRDVPGDPGTLGVDPGTLGVDPACLIYTSGTTSLPKAVVCTHQQMLFAATAIHSRLNYRADDVIYCPLPLSFDYGLYQLFLAALSGAQLRLGNAAEAGPPLMRTLEATGATVLAGVPSVSDRLSWLLTRGRQRHGQPLPALRLLTNTGAALPETTMASLRSGLPGLRIQVMYGLTECKRAAIMPPDGDLERPGSSGIPLPGTEMFVVSDDGERQPPGEIGQFVVRGPHVMAGYWRRPELSAERFPRAEGLFPQLVTGDWGWMDEEGYVYFSGRRDDLYKERGFRVSCTEVEAAACRVAGVDAAAVLPPGESRTALLAVVTELPEGEVVARMREEIEPFKIPRRCVRLAELPVNGNGKVDRKALAALVAPAPAPAAPSAPAPTAPTAPAAEAPEAPTAPASNTP